jgi:hypothetical protein
MSGLCVRTFYSFSLFASQLLINLYSSKNIAADFAKYGKINHKYAPSSGISNLRLHIESHHADEYVRLCVDNNWTMMLPKLRAAEEQSGQNPSVLSADPSQLPFSAKNFLRALVKFIVADDQVRDSRRNILFILD